MTKQIMHSFVFLVVMACGVASAEPTHPNEIGLYTNDDGTGETGTYLIGEPIELFLVLTKPTDDVNGNIPCTTYVGFELRMTFDPLPAGDLVYSGATFPEGCIDIGIKDMEAGYLEYAAALPAPIPVVNEAISVATLTFINIGTQVTQVFLGPGTGGFPAPTEMRFLGGHESSPDIILLGMYPVSGATELAVFEFNGAAVEVENQSFGSLKALFR